MSYNLHHIFPYVNWPYFEQNWYPPPPPPHFWAFLAKKANFGPFLAKKGQLSNFRRAPKKRIFIGSVHQAKNSRKADFGKFLAKTVKISGKFFLNFWTLTSYKIFEKYDERFLRKGVMHARTRRLCSQWPVGRDYKKWMLFAQNILFFNN